MMMDPKVAAIMARLEADEKQQKTTVVEKVPVKAAAPTNLDEFIKVEGLVNIHFIPH